MTGQTEQTGQL